LTSATTSANRNTVSLSLAAHSAVRWSSTSAVSDYQCKQQQMNWFRSLLKLPHTKFICM